MSIIYEEFRGGLIAHIAEFPDASPEECPKAVRRMNGADRSLVSIKENDLMISIGGGDGAFVVTVETSRSIRNLLGSHPDPDEDDFIDITVGSQACEYPRCYAVGSESVESALPQLLEKADVDLHWEIVGK